MSDEKARPAAEDHYYAALDLVAEGITNRPSREYQQSLAADPLSPRPCTAWRAPCRI